VFEENLRNCGKLVGKISGKIIMNDPPFLQQMICGVHTENGFSVVTPSVLQNEESVLSFNLCGNQSKTPQEVS